MIGINDLIKFYIVRGFIDFLVIVVLISTPFIFIELSNLIKKIRTIKKP